MMEYLEEISNQSTLEQANKDTRKQRKKGIHG
jgi:hypothetical protein